MPATRAAGASIAAVVESAAGRAARTATAKPAAASIAIATRSRDRGGGTVGLWSADPCVASSRGARFYVGRTWAGGRRCGYRMCYAHAGGPPIQNQGLPLRYRWNRPGISPSSATVGGPQHRGVDDAGTSSGGDTNETGTWGSVDADGRFPSLIDIFLGHGGSLETVQELIRGVKARTEEEMENWATVGSFFEPPPT